METQYTWFNIFNRTTFLALGLVSKTYTQNLEGVGERDVLVTNAQGLGITYEGIFLAVELNDENPFAFEGHAVYVDADNEVWLGIEVDDD